MTVGGATFPCHPEATPKDLSLIATAPDSVSGYFHRPVARPHRPAPSGPPPPPRRPPPRGRRRSGAPGSRCPAAPRPRRRPGPTGLRAVAPLGPAIPVVETAMSAPNARRAPSAIARAHSSLTAPTDSNTPAGTPSSDSFASVRIGDDAAQEVGGAAGHGGDPVGDLPAGAGLGGRHRHRRGLAEQREKTGFRPLVGSGLAIDGFPFGHGVGPDQARTGRRRTAIGSATITTGRRV